MTGDCLFIELPSGRKLIYPMPRITYNTQHRRDELNYTEYGYKQPARMYGGRWAAHITQATARDLLAEALVRIDGAGYDIVLHAHDEVIVEIAEELTLPIAAKGWVGERYRA